MRSRSLWMVRIEALLLDRSGRAGSSSLDYLSASFCTKPSPIHCAWLRKGGGIPMLSNFL